MPAIVLLLLAVAVRAGGPHAFSRGRLVHGPGPCRHVGDQFNTVAARSFLAHSILVGKARSRSHARRPGDQYAVTFVVLASLRQPAPLPAYLKPGSPIRLPFKSKPAPTRSKPLLCQQNYDFSVDKVIWADIKRGGKYLLFLTGEGPLNFSLLGEPVIYKRKTLKAVKEVLQECRTEGVVRGLKNVTAMLEKNLKLVCKSRGNPLPAISWYKDDRPLIVSKRVRIEYKKRRSQLEVTNVLNKDAGRYECRATDITGKISSTWSVVTVAAKKHNVLVNETHPIRNPLPCPIPFCLNGGTCLLYKEVAEMVCKCADGFKGVRCGNKDVYNHSSYYRPMSYFCKLGISSSYYC